MNYLGAASRSFALHVRLLRIATSLFTCLAVCVASLRAADTGGGSVAGSVMSAKTHNALQGALVTVPALNRTELTDNSGAFLLQGLPVGSIDVVISYTGFDDERRTITVSGGQPSRFDAELKPAQALMM